MSRDAKRNRKALFFYRRNFEFRSGNNNRDPLERKSGTQLDFAARSHGHGDGAELWGIDETIRRAEIDFVQGVESFSAELKVKFFRNAESTLQSDVHRLHSRPRHSVPTDVAVSKGRRCSEGRWIKPLVRSVRSGTKNRLSGDVSANRVFTQHGTRICGVAENRNRERHSRLDLVDGRECPILREQTGKLRTT